MAIQSPPMNLLKPAFRPLVQSYRSYKNRHCRDYFLEMLPKHSVGVEIGVWEGGLSREILRVVKPATLYLVDPWKHFPELERAWYGGKKESQPSMDTRYLRVCDRFSDRSEVFVIRGASAEILPNLPMLHWAIVDGDHRHEGVLTDLRLVHCKVKHGALIVCDDYVKEGKWWRDGVKRGVADALAQGLYELVLVRENQAILRAL
jgi:hypothetical protein